MMMALHSWARELMFHGFFERACSGKFSAASLSQGMRITKQKTRPFHLSLESRKRIMNIKPECLQRRNRSIFPVFFSHIYTHY
jgi:hypothetical protein